MTSKSVLRHCSNLREPHAARTPAFRSRILISSFLYMLFAFGGAEANSIGYTKAKLEELGYDMSACAITPASDYRSRTNVGVTFINDYTFTSQPAWIDLKGLIHLRKVITSNDSKKEKTYAGTNWLFFDYQGKKCLGLWTASTHKDNTNLNLSSVGDTTVKVQPFSCIWGDCFDGIGKEVWPSGVSYVGEHRDGRRSGYGIFFDADGDVCESYFKEGFANGPSSCLYKNGERFFGYMIQGKRSGYGFYVDSEGITVKEGIYKSDKLISRTFISSKTLLIEIDQLRKSVHESLISAYLPAELYALPEIKKQPDIQELPPKILNQDTNSGNGGAPNVRSEKAVQRTPLSLNERLSLAAFKLHANKRSNIMWRLDKVSMNHQAMRLELSHTLNTEQFNPSEKALLEASVQAYCNSGDTRIFIENNIPSLWIYVRQEQRPLEFLVGPSSCER